MDVFSKLIPPSKKQIHKHKDQMHSRDVWRSNVEASITVQIDLRATYVIHKKDFPLFRYGELKKMTKLYLQQFSNIVQQMSTISRNDKSGENDTDSDDDDDDTKPRRKPTMVLMAEVLAKTERILKEAEIEHKYSEMTNKQLKTEIRELHDEELHLKSDFEQLNDKFNSLRQQYEDSKRENIFIRYRKLKEMIITASTPINRPWML